MPTAFFQPAASFDPLAEHRPIKLRWLNLAGPDRFEPATIRILASARPLCLLIRTSARVYCIRPEREE